MNEELYRRVYKACQRAYSGGTSFGIGWRTISEGWRNAFRRAGYYGPAH